MTIKLCIILSKLNRIFFITSIEIFKSEKKEDKEREEKIKMLIEKRKKLDELKRKKHQSELIKVLHRYNDLKDLSQELLGRIAVKKNITVKELYTELDISED